MFHQSLFQGYKKHATYTSELPFGLTKCYIIVFFSSFTYHLTMKKVSKTNIFIILLWATIVCFTMFHHELWRDEAQAWCLVRDLNIFDAFKMTRIEGHPFLWYLLLIPFAKLGFSVVSMQLISFIFATTAVCLLIFKSPFNTIEKILICFSAGMIYYMPVVARSYSLAPLLIFLIAYFYPQRKEKPLIYTTLILLLSHTHNYLLGLSGILFLMFTIETFMSKKVIYKVLSTTLLCNFILIFSIFYGVSSENYILEDMNYSKIPIEQIVPFVGKVVTLDIFNTINFHNSFTDYIALVLFVVPLILMTYFFYKNNKKVLIIYLFSICFILFIFSKVYLFGLLYQKIFLMYLILICCYWIQKNEHSKYLNIAKYGFIILFAISILTSPIIINKEFKYNFSGSKQIAEYIKSNLPNEEVFAAYGNPYVYSAISAYLPTKKLYNPISESYISYFSYEKNISKKTAIFPEEVKYFIIQDKEFDVESIGFKTIFETNKENLSSVSEKEVFKLCIE